MEKLGLGPEVLCVDNPGLIYARMTGWGQKGDPAYVYAAGHDSNYISISGALDLFRRGEERPLPPGNFAGDYAGGGTMMAMGVLLAVIERSKSGKGQVIDVAMCDGANYVALPMFKWMQPGGIFPSRPDGHLDATTSPLHQAPYWSTT
jgi:alpha-methylacyl-CoA racemase